MSSSIIIPAFNEGDRLVNQVAHLREGQFRGEIIASLPHHDHSTLLPAPSYDITVIRSEKGRAKQMNEAAAIAGGDVLIFLHADTNIAVDSINKLGDALGKAGAGAYRFEVDAKGFKYRLIEMMVFLRSTIFKLPYGDQAIFIRRDLFEDVGCYSDIPLMEDVDLIDKVKRSGAKIVILEESAKTSARRWEKKGIFITTISNWLTLLAYRVGVSPERLSKLYH